jgi:hypothetical protein
MRLLAISPHARVPRARLRRIVIASSRAFRRPRGLLARKLLEGPAMPPQKLRALEVLPIAMILGIGLGACDRDNPTSTTRTTSGSAPADDTKINERDQPGGVARTAPTPLDQGNDSDDLAVTKRIRKALIADDTISSDAKNVKIITVDGVVTLRGPVRNAEEHAKVARIAESLAPPDRVNDELDIERYK